MSLWGQIERDKNCKDFAASQGKSLNRFICDAIEAEMNKSKDNR